MAREALNTTCKVPSPLAAETTTAHKPTPFTLLTSEEVHSIVEWLFAPERALNLTDASLPELAMTDNYLRHIEELKPNKTDVLAYLDGGVPMPRFARVLIHEGAAAVPGVVDYYVGPLPISAETTMKPLDYFYNGVNGPKVLFNGAHHDGPRAAAIDKFIAKEMTAMADITLDVFGLAFYGTEDNRTTFSYFVTNPYSRDGTQGLGWSMWRRGGNTIASYAQPTDLNIRWEIGGTDPSLYKLDMIVYDNKIYRSAAEFRSAWKAGDLTIRPKLTGDSAYVYKDRKGPVRDLENRMAPTTIEPDGKRYKLDTKNKYIEYMGWKFYTRFDHDVGLQFYDVKFKDERVLYELSMQDAIAQYAGNQPFQGSTAYMDRHYGIGSLLNRLIPGYDCPYHATYWSAEYNSGLEKKRTNNSICIFETDIGTPITRHTEPSGPRRPGYLQSTKGSKLIIRQIATVGNYDYLWDYAFYVDGTITVDAYASGYVQATYYRPEDKGQWGPRINDLVSGTLHTHVMNFKADFDLIDTANSFIKTDIVVENVTKEWAPELGEFEMMRYNFTTISSESQGLLPGIANGQTMYTVENTAKKNKWGEARGYRIIPGLSNVGLTSKTNPFFLKSAEFAKQPFAVSRHKDTEQASSSALNQNVPLAPPVEFWKFFEDDEDLVQQDIVAWVNLGMQHYTRAEDMPNTLMSEAHSSIMFAPMNWGDAELTVDLQNAVIYNDIPGHEGQVLPETNGVSPPAWYTLSAADELLGVFEGVGIGKTTPHAG
ncbi:copper amine oxidase [Microdochium bolleyi]|uniref:Amine oxidase n=1 Tax=Microdochium bolleyi TaxID=196109 RepID=A0A136IU14_9PEZI|nr:copper amine oxidase [Microdochium bolleyi]